MSTLPNSNRNANVRMLKQIEEIKELWILPTVFFLTNGSVLLLIGEAKCKLVSEDSVGPFGCTIRNRIA